jgi:hypothetical protein
MCAWPPPEIIAKQWTEELRRPLKLDLGHDRVASAFRHRFETVSKAALVPAPGLPKVDLPTLAHNLFRNSLFEAGCSLGGKTAGHLL